MKSKQHNPYPHIIPDIEDWPIAKFAERRDEFILDLRKYTMEKILKHKKYDTLDLLQKCIFLEKKRIKGEAWKVDPRDEAKFWNTRSKELRDITSQEKHSTKDYLPVLEKIIHRYAEEIVGDFKPKTFRFARKFLTIFFKRIYGNWSLRRPFKLWGDRHNLLSKFTVVGPVEKVRRLYKEGTVVFVPTHFSNIDSILLGYKIDFNIGIPAFIYGAGLNLYNSEIVAYFMNRLGTYRVDRRKRNTIYIETLKSMNTLSIIQGVNNLFFPGGTRSRSGAIESKIKYGLLNSTVEAQRYCYENDIDRKIFIVPIVTRYPFVLEASSLISQHLAKIGKERYYHIKPQRSMTSIALSFMRKMYYSRGKSYMSFGEPMDVFGNKLDAQGNSYDNNGNLIDIRSYFDGLDSTANYVQRERVYTQMLGENILEQYREINLIIPSHLLAYLAYKLIVKLTSENDIFNLIILDKKHFVIDVEDVLRLFTKFKKAVNNGDLEVKLSPEFDLDEETLLKEALDHLGKYNPQKSLYYKSADTLACDSIKLLYYYHNQLSSAPIDKWFRGLKLQ